jgi:hypothetical protein
MLHGPVSSLYESILAFVEHDMKYIIDIAESICSRVGKEGDSSVDAKLQLYGIGGAFQLTWSELWSQILVHASNGMSVAVAEPENHQQSVSFDC